MFFTTFLIAIRPKMRRIQWLCCLVLVFGTIAPPRTSAQSSIKSPKATEISGRKSVSQDQSGGSSEAEIQELIELLGSDSYATRVRARNRLKRFGLEAFDALRKAQDHSDSEILSAARFLMSSLQVSWSKETDPDEVRKILFEYGGQDETERLGRIELLGNLSENQGVEALARLTRFEPSIPLSRRAAILVLEQPISALSAERLSIADDIESAVGGNDRDGCKWLNAYAADLRRGGFDLSRWSAIVANQRAIVNNGSSDNVTADSVMQLVRKIAGRALEEGQFSAAVELVKENSDLVAQRTRDISEHCNWAIEKGLHPVVLSIYEDNRHLFGENAPLLYSVALSNGELGQQAEADALADRAFALDPFAPLPDESEASEDGEAKPEKKDGPPAMTDHQREELGKRRLQVAFALRIKGLFPWAEREYRYIFENCKIDMPVAAVARYQLAELYNERLQHHDVVDVLFPVVDRLEKDKAYRSIMASSSIRTRELQSLYKFNRGLAILQDNQKKADAESMARVKSFLQKAYLDDKQNIDILIKMYRIEDPNDADWKPTVVRQIAQQRSELELQIGRFEEGLKNDPNSATTKAALAMLLNQYAWLVANTEGDYERAVRSSKRSLELSVNQSASSRSARLDTLARCYFAVGDLPNAIKTQKEAVSLEPNSPQMIRQLKEFEDAYQQ